MSDDTGSPRSLSYLAEPLQIEKQRHGTTVLLKVSGVAAAEVAGQLSRALQEAAREKPKLLAVDLAELSFIGSLGLGGLVAAHVTCEKNGVQIFLINPRKFIREILVLTKLSTLFKVCDTLAEAEQLASAG